MRVKGEGEPYHKERDNHWDKKRKSHLHLHRTYRLHIVLVEIINIYKKVKC